MIIAWFTDVFATGKEDGTIRDVNELALKAAATLSLLEGTQITPRVEEDIAMFDKALELLNSLVKFLFLGNLPSFDKLRNSAR